jgi:hypothetical protein
MIHEAVAVFCGPRDEGDGSRPQRRRIDAGIAQAVANGLPLIIAGDNHCGAEVRYYGALARDAGVCRVLEQFDPEIPRPNTLTDAVLIVHGLIALRCPLVHVVTDHWHMARAAGMVQGEAYGLVTGVPLFPRLQVLRAPVMVGPTILTDEIRENEARGLRDYRAGRYGTTRPAFDPLAHGTSLLTSVQANV